MSAELDRRAIEVLEAALEAEPADREAFVAKRCGADSALRARVEALLEKHPLATGFLDQTGDPGALSLSGELAGFESTRRRLSVGEQLGNFVVEEPLGAGGMGEVYRARDLRLERSVALKVLPPQLAGDSGLRKRFLREARAISQLTHPRICTLYDVGDEEGLDFLVMELLEGETLSAELARGPLPLERAISTAIEIAEALERAHVDGIVHRDLKPGNVMRTPTGIKVLDFGLAKVSRGAPAEADTAGPDPTTAQGVIMGTYAYMSPEQARGRSVDKQTDIWAFGCVLYELLSGRGAFGGETATDVLVAVLDQEPNWDALPEDLPRRLRSLLGRCLQKDPNRRLHDIADARIELQEILTEGARVHDPGRPTAAAGPRRWFSVAAVALAAAGLSALLVWSLLRPRGGPPVTTPTALSILLAPRERLEFGRSSPVGVARSAVTISPDGRNVVYVAHEDDGPQRLVLRRLDAFESSVIAGTEGAFHPFFSPDGEAVAYFTERGLHTVSLAGGRPLHVCEAWSPLGGTWGADGSIVFDFTGVLRRVAAAGGTPEPIELVPRIKGDYELRWPSFLPGRSEFLATSRAGVVLLVSLDSGRWREISGITGSSATYLSTGHIAVVRAGNLYAAPFSPDDDRVAAAPFLALGGLRTEQFGAGHFAVSGGGTLAFVPGGAMDRSEFVWRRRGDSGEIAIPGLGMERYGAFRLSPEADRLAYTVYRPRPQVWVFDFTTGRSFRVASEANGPVWSPAGEELYFQASRDGESGIYRSTVTPGAKPERLLPLTGVGAPDSVSRDGKWLLFAEASPATEDDVYRLRLDDGAADPEALVQTPRNEWGPALSPNGKWVAYTSEEPDGSEVFIVPFSTGAPRTQVSTEGGEEPVWSPDNDELFFRNGDQWYSVTVTSAQKLELGVPKLILEGPYLNVRGYSHDYDGKGDRFLLLRAIEEDVHEIRIVTDWSNHLRAGNGE